MSAAAPTSLEILYFDGCPHYEALLPHLHDLLAAHGITIPMALTRIDNDEEAQDHRFLGSPTVRVNGRDVEPGSSEREHRETAAGSALGGSPYGIQCRLYPTADGTVGVPRDAWILYALTADHPD